MRFILWGAILASFAVSAFGRYLPPDIIANVSQSRQITNRSLVTSTTLFSSADSPTLSNPSSIYLNGVHEKGVCNTDETITTQSLGHSANDALRLNHVGKGKSLMCAMLGTDATAGWQLHDTRTPPSAASKWVNFNDMAAWYWFEGKFDPDICEMGTFWGMRTTFQALKVNPKSNKYGNGLQCFIVQHQNENAKYPDGKPRGPQNQSYTVDGKLYHVCSMLTVLTYSTLLMTVSNRQTRRISSPWTFEPEVSIRRFHIS